MNFDKSSVIFSENTSQVWKSEVCGILSGLKEHKNVKYLGLPMGIGKSKKQVFNYVLKKV